jgi:hypothetical protein
MDANRLRHLRWGQALIGIAMLLFAVMAIYAAAATPRCAADAYVCLPSEGHLLLILGGLLVSGVAALLGLLLLLAYAFMRDEPAQDPRLVPLRR